MNSSTVTKSKTKKILGIVGNSLLWLFVAFAVVITILIFTSQQNEAGLPTLFGRRMVNILSDSMYPFFKTGDLILVRTPTVEESHDLEIGTVITYIVDLNNDGVDELNTHRIVETRKESGYTYYTTKGDNNGANDSEISSLDIVGVYDNFRIGGIGSIMSFLQTGTGFLVVIVIPLVLFFLFELYNFISIVMKVKKKKISKEDEERIKQEAIAEYLRRQEEAKKAAEGQTVAEKPVEDSESESK